MISTGFRLLQTLGGASTIAEATACFSSRHISASAIVILGKIGVVMCKRRPPQIALIGFPYPLKQFLSSQYMET